MLATSTRAPNVYCSLEVPAAIVTFCVLASSSAGNCAFLRAGRTRLLIDAGLSRRETAARLAAIGERIDEIDAILVTHEHSDHVCGLPGIAKRSRVPIYTSHGTARMLTWDGTAAPPVETFQAGTGGQIGDVEFRSFTIPHDAADPVGLWLRGEGIVVGIATDLGYVPESLAIHLRGTHLLLLESNHDIEMLKVGPYPWSIKQRVMGRRGHLSNDLASRFLGEGMDERTQTVILGHLSEHNNHPELARLAAAEALLARDLPAQLVVAEPRRQSQAFVLG